VTAATEKSQKSQAAVLQQVKLLRSQLKATQAQNQADEKHRENEQAAREVREARDEAKMKELEARLASEEVSRASVRKPEAEAQKGSLLPTGAAAAAVGSVQMVGTKQPNLAPDLLDKLRAADDALQRKLVSSAISRVFLAEKELDGPPAKARTASKAAAGERDTVVPQGPSAEVKAKLKQFDKEWGAQKVMWRQKHKLAVDAYQLGLAEVDQHMASWKAERAMWKHRTGVALDVHMQAMLKKQRAENAAWRSKTKKWGEHMRQYEQQWQQNRKAWDAAKQNLQQGKIHHAAELNSLQEKMRAQLSQLQKTTSKYRHAWEAEKAAWNRRFKRAVAQYSSKVHTDTNAWKDQHRQLKTSMRSLQRQLTNLKAKIPKFRPQILESTSVTKPPTARRSRFSFAEKVKKLAARFRVQRLAQKLSTRGSQAPSLGQHYIAKKIQQLKKMNGASAAQAVEVSKPTSALAQPDWTMRRQRIISDKVQHLERKLGIGGSKTASLESAQDSLPQLPPLAAITGLKHQGLKNPFLGAQKQSQEHLSVSSEDNAGFRKSTQLPTIHEIDSDNLDVLDTVESKVNAALKRLAVPDVPIVHADPRDPDLSPSYHSSVFDTVGQMVSKAENDIFVDY